MAAIKARKKPINQPVVFFDTLADLRRANGQDPELGYLTAYACPAGDGFVAENAYKGFDGRFYHNVQCFEIADMMGEVK